MGTRGIFAGEILFAKSGRNRRVHLSLTRFVCTRIATQPTLGKYFHMRLLVVLLLAQRIASAPPNVLLISSDSMDGRVLDSNQHLGRAVPMPYLRALAARGANFVTAYSPSPVCGPSRASALTSRYVSDIGVYNNYQEIAQCPKCEDGVDPTCVKWYGIATCKAWAAQFPVPLDLFQAFEDAGFEMGVFGKIDIGAGTPLRYLNSSGGDDHTGSCF